MSSLAGSTSLTSHLADAVCRPLNTAVFLDGYRDALEAVGRHGIFRIQGLTIESPEGVYPPDENSSTRFVLKGFRAAGLGKLFGEGRLLELGCGAGALGLYAAARYGWRVSAGDIDPRAVAATRLNAQRNQLQVDVRLSDLFEAFQGEMFDAIVFNQPFFHLERAPLQEEIALSAEGGALHARFMAQAAQHLRPGGQVVFTYSNCSDPAALESPGWSLKLCSFDYDGESDYVRCLFSGMRR